MRNFHIPGRSPVFATSGMVAASHPLAASEALSILKNGGNATDAAIAGAVLLGVCEPHMTGIGGDCFALVKPAGQNDVIAMNGSGHAPAALNPETLRAEGLSVIPSTHHAAITVPGAVDAFCSLSERFGKLGIDHSLAPAIRYFDEGVPIAPRVASDVASKLLTKDAARHFANNGEPYETGDVLRLPAQAEVLRRIVKDGRGGFYSGEVAEDMLTTLTAFGGTHTAADFANVQTLWDTPVSGTYRDLELIEHPPNGQGAIAILLAGILNHFEITNMDPNGAARVHLEAEATKLAYDARDRFLGDPRHTTRLDHLLDPRTAERLATLIDPKRAMPAPTPLSEEVHRDTVLITVVDKDGMAVSLIYSIFATFGSMIASSKFGVLFHNRGAGFNLIKGHPNEAGPGKRPMHTIIPAMTAENGQINMTFGVMGGQYQATGHAHFLGNMVDFGMDPQQAIDAPRSFLDPQSGMLRVEDTLSEETCATLVEMGHKLERPDTAIGGAQAIKIDHARGTLIGASDPRKDGCAIGY